MKKKRILIAAVVLIAAGITVYVYNAKKEAEIAHAKFASGNGRLEATEISISSKLSGRIDDIMVDEGDYVKKGQKLVQIQTNVLQAQLDQAKAALSKAIAEEKSAQTQVSVKIAERDAALATVKEKSSYLAGAKKRFDRSKTLEEAKAQSKQTFENHETDYLMAQAALAKARVLVKQAEAEILKAKADASGAKANVKAAKADIARIQADIDDSLLLAPREGRIKYKIAQGGEVVSAGGRILNLVDLTDAYMTFYLPERLAGKVHNGAEVRLIFDAMKTVPIPAKVTYVASVAQFTPKTVETQSEREKLMFRVKAKIDPALLKKYISWVKTGVPGVAYVKLDPKAPWPKNLQLKKFGKN